MKTPQGNAADWLAGAFKKNPESFLLLAAGAVLLMRHGGRNAQVQAVASDAVAPVASAAAGVRDYAADVTDRTMRSASAMASAASGYGTRATRRAGEQSGRIVQQARDGMVRVANDQPLVIAMAGMAAGAALASVLRPTHFEQETLAPIGEQVVETATRVGDQLREATASAGETLKKAADERGLNAEGLSDVASEVAGAFKGSFASADGTGSEASTRDRTKTDHAP
jgi:hypothetical protein